MTNTPADGTTFETLATFVAYLETIYNHCFIPGPDMAVDILARQAVIPNAMEMGLTYECFDCTRSFVVMGSSDGMGYQIGPRGACMLAVDEDLFKPCVDAKIRGVTIEIRHLQDAHPSCGRSESPDGAAPRASVTCSLHIVITEARDE